MILIYEKSSKLKIKIYRYLFTNNEFVLWSDISALFKINIATVKRYVLEIKDFLPEGVIREYRKGVICQKKIISPYELEKKYFTDDIYFKILKKITCYAYYTHETLAQDLYLSSSHLYKIISSLNESIKDMDLYIENKNSNIVLLGNSFSIMYIKWILSTQNIDSTSSIEKEKAKFFLEKLFFILNIEKSPFDKTHESFMCIYKWIELSNTCQFNFMSHEQELLLKEQLFDSKIESDLKFLYKKNNFKVSSYYLRLTLIGLFFSNVILGSCNSKIKFLNQNLLYETKNKLTPFFEKIQTCLPNNAINDKLLFSICAIFKLFPFLEYGLIFAGKKDSYHLMDSSNYFEIEEVVQKNLYLIPKNIKKNFKEELLVRGISIILLYSNKMKGLQKLNILVESTFGENIEEQIIEKIKNSINFISTKEVLTETKYDLILKDDYRICTDSKVPIFSFEEFEIQINKWLFTMLPDKEKVS
ncbi:helix-turn-helix domain-containing protein [Enterococcus avium]|uniref:helix-turn-helix domain-containing protein n=1 Tax=Enterococcus avium TaxID=33945 RepID=UPI001F59962A|nr:helix-turn-helix domain-containing protein [Enterococcus avium]